MESSWPGAARGHETVGVRANEAEICGQCGFDSRRWRRRDAADLFDSLGWWWAQATAGVDPAALDRRPAPAVWSVLEYGQHSALAAAVIRTSVEQILEVDGAVVTEDFDIGEATVDNWAGLDLGATLADLTREGSALAALARRAGEAWSNIGTLEGSTVGAEAYLIHDVHDLSHHFWDVARALAQLAPGSPGASGSEGRVARINVSDGGVPKAAVAEATVAHEGLSGDRQRDRKHHGRPFQAVCLWSSEVIDELASFGHPIGPGCAGENLTLAGLDWSKLRPGTLLRLGEALIELSFPAVPCRHQAQWFADGDFSRIAFEVNPRWVRWYGWVRQPGRVSAGAPVTVGA